LKIKEGNYYSIYISLKQKYGKLLFPLISFGFSQRQQKKERRVLMVKATKEPKLRRRRSFITDPPQLELESKPKTSLEFVTSWQHSTIPSSTLLIFQEEKHTPESQEE